MSFPIPYSLLNVVIESIDKIESQTDARITIENNVLSVTGSLESQQTAIVAISELLKEKSETIPPREDLCIRIDNIKADDDDIQTELQEAFKGKATRYKFNEENGVLTAFVEFSTQQERDLELAQNPFVSSSQLIFSIPEVSVQPVQEQAETENSEERTDQVGTANQTEPVQSETTGENVVDLDFDLKRSIWIGQIPDTATDDSVMESFTSAGVQPIKLEIFPETSKIRNRGEYLNLMGVGYGFSHTGTNSRIGFVEFQQVSEAKYVISEFDTDVLRQESEGVEMNHIAVSKARERGAELNTPPKVPESIGRRLKMTYIREYAMDYAGHLVGFDFNLNPTSNRQYDMNGELVARPVEDDVPMCYYYQAITGCTFQDGCKNRHCSRYEYERWVKEHPKNTGNSQYANHNQIPSGEPIFNLVRHGIRKGKWIFETGWKQMVLLLFGRDGKLISNDTQPDLSDLRDIPEENPDPQQSEPTAPGESEPVPTTSNDAPPPVKFVIEPGCCISIDDVLQSVNNVFSVSDGTVLKMVVLRKAYSGPCSAMTPAAFAILEFVGIKEAVKYNGKMNTVMRGKRGDLFDGKMLGVYYPPDANLEQGTLRTETERAKPNSRRRDDERDDGYRRSADGDAPSYQPKYHTMPLAPQTQPPLSKEALIQAILAQRRQ
ncbi:hypothetical protein BLNAU_338 [Blattamonas nauphoetae]|uniref:RRM domain-containing protein n=1 Tax=Blattamonas nauphoetae TaxID=2049346 RepID=A0ABQ9YKZ5_9EUKA|nr:hypothetical protein BLNAU_338 [Blattamonas nauphoetae]